MNDLTTKLKQWMRPTEQILKDLRQHVLDWRDNSKHRIFIDRSAAVLFVAHLDTVQKPKFIRCRKTKSKKLKRIYAQGLDDRLGCMLAFELSKELGADLLLTDHEEAGSTTAKFHDCKNYNWIVEFDRAGSDVVTYGRDSSDFLKALQKYWSVNWGLYSDICDLKTDVCCFNIGIGYELAHSKDSYATVDTIKNQIELFKQFYIEYKDIQFIQESKFDDSSYWQNEAVCCDICGMIGAELIFSYFVCQDCFEQMIYEKVLDKQLQI